MSDLREYFESIVYHTRDRKRRRFTQQSPVMPDVWIHYGMNPGRKQELLMVPNWHYTPASLAKEIKAQLAEDAGKKWLSRFRDKTDKRPSAIAYNQNVVVATLWFDELVRAVMPLSRWWARSVAQMERSGDEDQLALGLDSPEELADNLATAMESGEAPIRIAPDTVWLAQVAGLIATISTQGSRKRMAKLTKENTRLRYLARQGERHRELSAELVQLLKGVSAVAWDDDFPLYSVNRNRETATVLHDSVASVKADAARRIFEVQGEGIRWAVIDSGVDAEHVAFRKRDPEGRLIPEPFPPRRKGSRRRKSSGSKFSNQTRIVATYDFVHIRELLSADPDSVDDLDRERFPALKIARNRSNLKRILSDLESHVIDWERLEPFLEVVHEPKRYHPPENRHGTHVAGIIAADWRRSEEWAVDDPQDLEDPPTPRSGDLQGICPRIELYDLRVLDEDGAGNEFAIMSALQFVRDLNNRKDFVAIHGVNLSFSIEHDVANYACGRTPVCEEAERLVGSGTMVVAAAGNNGRARYLTPTGIPDDGFRTVSITDPGNAEAVLTVGATHRRDAQTYGVSYFSSRGPTGDGRLKPDLVAPGEKIKSTVPGQAEDRLDGTSMAAPHVSGAAALIMTRHAELIGHPKRIKETLCSTTTDLKRERYFQGAGMVDILRALESI